MKTRDPKAKLELSGGVGRGVRVWIQAGDMAGKASSRDGERRHIVRLGGQNAFWCMVRGLRNPARNAGF